MSRTIAVGIAFLVGSSFGGCIGALFQSSETTDRSDTSDSTKSARAMTIDSDASDVVREIQVAQSGTATAVAPSPVVDEATLRADPKHSSREAVEAEPAVIGTGTIQGRVVDAQGEPLAGATIVATTSGDDLVKSSWRKSSRGKAMPRPRSLEEQLASARDAIRRSQLSRVEATSNDEGLFALTGLRDVPYDLQAWAEGYVIEPKSLGSSIRPGDHVEFVAEVAIDVPLRVLHPDGTLADRASIYITPDGSDDCLSDLWMNDVPEIRVARGRYRFQAIARWIRDSNAPALETQSDEVVIDLTDGIPSAPVELLLKTRRGVRGRVAFGSLMTTSYFSVGIAHLPKGQEFDPHSPPEFDDSTWVNRSDPEYTLLDLEYGRYLVALRVGSSGPILASQVVQVDQDEVVEIDLSIADMESTRHLTVATAGPTGMPVGDIDFYLNAIDQSGAMTNRDDPDELLVGRGVYEVLISDEFATLLDHPDPNVRVVLVARSSHFGTVEQSLASHAREASVRFLDPAKLSVRILGYGSLGFESRLSLGYVKADPTRSRWTSSEQINSRGVATIGPVAPGVYRVSLSMEHDGWGSQKLYESEATLVSGTNELSISVPPLYTLNIRTPGLACGTIMIESESGDGQSIEFTEGGLSIPNLIAGNYTISCSSDEAEERVAEIRVPDQLNFDLKKPISGP